MIGKFISTLGGSKEKLTFGVYIIVVLLSAFFVSDVLVLGWERGHLIVVLLEAAPFILLGITADTLGTFLFGAYLGLLLLLNIDPKKRWQGRLLILGTIIAVVAMQTQGVFEIEIIQNLPGLGGGILVGLIIGGGSKVIRDQVAEALEFRRAASIIYYVLALVTIVTLLEAHVEYPPLFDYGYAQGYLEVAPFPLEPEVDIATQSVYQHTIATGVFLFTLGKFMKYDAERSFFIIGPSESGKTLFLMGSYLEALESYSGGDGELLTTPMNPTQDLIEMLDQFDRTREEWAIGATGAGEVRELGFRYVHGQVFPLNVQIQALDYAGEHLGSIPDALSGVLDIEDYPNPAILRALVENIREADSLILIIDTERFLQTEDSLEIADYFDLLQAIDNKQVVLMATKTDLLAEEFTEETGLQPVRHYDDFVKYVNHRFSQNQQIQSLITETVGTKIHPVYYQTRITDNGERVPMRDQSDSIMVVGFDEFLEEIGS